MRFRAILESSGKQAAGLHVPVDVIEGLGGGKRPKVAITINGHTWRTSVGIINGEPMIGVPMEQRGPAGVQPGDVIEVDVVLDTSIREVQVPPDFASALAAAPEAERFFSSRNYSERRWFVLGIEDAKTPETRARRIEKAVARLSEGRGQR